MLTKQINRLRLLAAVLAGLLLSGCAGRSPAAYTVSFLDEDAAVLSVQTVTHGQAAAAPVVSDSTGHVFAGWDGDFRCVTEELTLTAQYISSENPTLFVPREPPAESFSCRSKSSIIRELPAPRSHWFMTLR